MKLTYECCLQFLSEFENNKDSIIRKIKYGQSEYYETIISSILNIYHVSIEMKKLFFEIKSLDSKINNSSNEVILFLDKIIKETQSAENMFKDVTQYLSCYTNINICKKLYMDVFYDCFQDIYALEYIIKNPPIYYFSIGHIYKILDMIYTEKLKEINDENQWNFITSDDSYQLLSHSLLPFPTDFKKVLISNDCVI